MGHASGIRHALLGVVSTSSDGLHGYALKTQCERVLGSFWQLNFGEIYRVLDRLAAEGLIEQAPSEVGSNRKIYRITAKGQQTLDDFILAPPTDAPRPLRHELAVKLLFARPDQLRDVLNLIDYQREAYMQQVRMLEVQRRKLRRLRTEAFVTNLLIDGAELNVRAEITWLDEVAEKLKVRLSED